MHITLILDDDVATTLELAAHRRGLPLHEMANEMLRRGLQQEPVPSRAPFRVTTRDMGKLREGINLDNAISL